MIPQQSTGPYPKVNRNEPSIQEKEKKMRTTLQRKHWQISHDKGLQQTEGPQ